MFALTGWIKLHRKIQEHWLWQDKPFDKRSAWIDLLLMANHDYNKFLLGNELVEVERGSFITSELKLMERWGWSNTKLRNFLSLLQKDGMIIKKSDNKKSAIIIANYNDYQITESTKEVQEKCKESAEKVQENTNKNVKNVKNVKNDKKLNNNIISRPETPYEEIVNLYNTICISFNSIKQITDKRKGNINARYQESKCSIEVFKILFTKMQDSNFLKGGWDLGGKADFDWVMRPTNFVKVLEGKYDNRNQKQQTGNKQSNLSELMEMIEGGVFDE